jgi:hypothetical protein
VVPPGQESRSPLTIDSRAPLTIESRSARTIQNRTDTTVHSTGRIPDISAAMRPQPPLGPRTQTNAFGFTNLVDVGDVRVGDGLRSIERVPPLDPGSRYVGTIQSIPGRPVRIAWTPGPRATVEGGAPVLGRAAVGADAHADQAQRFFGRASATTAGFEVEYGGTGPVVLRTDVPALNRAASRIGAREFAPLTEADVQAAGGATRIPDRQAVVELARYVAQATGRPVLIGDPPIDGVPYPGVLSPPVPARQAAAPEPPALFGPRQAFNAFGVSNLVRTREGIRATDVLPPLPPEGTYQGVISSPRDGRVSIAWEPDAAVGRIEPAPLRPGAAPTRAERFFSRADPALAGDRGQGSVLAGFQATYSRDGTVVLGIRSPELNGAVTRIGNRELPPQAPRSGRPTPFFDDPAALGALARLVANQTRRTVVIGPDVSPAQHALVGREFAPDPLPDPGMRPPLGTLRASGRFDEHVDWERLVDARPLRGERRVVDPYEIPADPRQPDGPTRRVTVHAPDSMNDGELLTDATLQAIENPRSYDSPRAAARAARALDRAWVVEVTQTCAAPGGRRPRRRSISDSAGSDSRRRSATPPGPARATCTTGWTRPGSGSSSPACGSTARR